jgi:hypothetical protein
MLKIECLTLTVPLGILVSQRTSCCCHIKKTISTCEMFGRDKTKLERYEALSTDMQKSTKSDSQPDYRSKNG